MKQHLYLCDYCSEPFEPRQVDQRFCKPECHYLWHLEEKRAAIAAWRERKRLEEQFAVQRERKAAAG